MGFESETSSLQASVQFCLLNVLIYLVVSGTYEGSAAQSLLPGSKWLG